MTNKEIYLYRKLTDKKYPLSTLEKCEKCGSTNRLKRHHPQGLQNWSTVQILCNSCHVEAHRIENEKKKNYSIPTLKAKLQTLEWNLSLQKIENKELNEFREWIRKNHLKIWREYWEEKRLKNF